MDGLESELPVSDTAAGLAGSLEEGLANEAKKAEAVAIETASTKNSNEATSAGSQTEPSADSEAFAQLTARLEETTEVHAKDKAAHAKEKATHVAEKAAESKFHLFLVLVLIVLFGILLWLLLTSLL